MATPFNQHTNVPSSTCWTLQAYGCSREDGITAAAPFTWLVLLLACSPVGRKRCSSSGGSGSGALLIRFGLGWKNLWIGEAGSAMITPLLSPFDNLSCHYYTTWMCSHLQLHLLPQPVLVPLCGHTTLEL